MRYATVRDGLSDAKSRGRVLGQRCACNLMGPGVEGRGVVATPLNARTYRLRALSPRLANGHGAGACIYLSASERWMALSPGVVSLSSQQHSSLVSLSRDTCGGCGRVRGAFSPSPARALLVRGARSVIVMLFSSGLGPHRGSAPYRRRGAEPRSSRVTALSCCFFRAADHYRQSSCGVLEPRTLCVATVLLAGPLQPTSPATAVDKFTLVGRIVRQLAL